MTSGSRDGTEAGEAEDREITSARVIAAPGDAVWKAWTDPALLAKWWGPKGFTNTFHEFDPTPGGMWRFVMHGPDGHDYKNESVFVDVEPQRRIVFDHMSNPRFRVTATFEEAGEDKTGVTFHMRFMSAAECAAVRPIVVPSNEQNFDRLEAVLAEMN